MCEAEILTSHCPLYSHIGVLEILCVLCLCRSSHTCPLAIRTHVCNMNVVYVIFICGKCIVYMHVRLCMHMHGYMHVMLCMHVCMHACVYACMCVCMYACMHVCMYACMHVCMYACMHVCTYACMYVCMRVYIDILYIICAMHVCMHACI